MTTSTYKTTPSLAPLKGAGLGYRRGFADELTSADLSDLSFMEVAPENWIHVGGRLGDQLRTAAERIPFVFHGLSLSLGGNEPIDRGLVKAVQGLMQELGVKVYSEHLSACSFDGHLYDLMPIPMSERSARYVADRISEVQDILGYAMAVENVSAYLAPGQQMPEIDFIIRVLELADCKLLFDVNNLFVNSTNFGFDVMNYLRQVPTDRIAYMHIAGHYEEAKDLLVDTHGAAVKQDVWALLKSAYETHGVHPTLLERDFNYPGIPQLLAEVSQILDIQQQVLALESQNHANGASPERLLHV